MKHIVSVGGGLSSTIELPVEVIRKYGAENVDLVIAALNGEHPDLWRLVADCERLTGKTVTRIAQSYDSKTGFIVNAPVYLYPDIWDIFNYEGRMGSSLADPCSRVAKRETLRAYILSHYDPEDTVLHVGIKPDEIDRQLAIRSNWSKAGFKVEFDLCDNDQYTRAADLINWSPELYLHGFPHNNCGGFCVKAGHAQMARLLWFYPEIFYYHADKEHEFQKKHKTTATIMRDRVTRAGVVHSSSLTLHDFAERMDKRWAGRLPGFDPFDGLEDTAACKWCEATG